MFPTHGNQSVMQYSARMSDSPSRPILPLARIFQESWQLVIRESDVLVPLALSIFTLGHAGLLIAGGMFLRGQVIPMAMILLFASMFILVLGRIAVCRLVLQPGVSIGEALHKAAPRVSFAIWLLMFTWLMASFVGAIVLIVMGVDASKGPEALTALGGFALAPVYGVVLFVLARLFFLYPALAGSERGVQALKVALRGSRGRTLPLFGLVMLFLLLINVAQLAGSLIVGLVVGVIESVLGPISGGFAVVALGAGMAAAIPTLLATVFATKLYQHVSGVDGD
jgi:hypothetical protein